jgi:hypothetical protein
MPALRKFATAGRTWFPVLGVIAGIGLWIWYRDHQKTNLISQQELIYSSYKSSHTISKAVTPCQINVGESLGGRKGFVVAETDFRLHAVHHDMAATKRPAVDGDVSFIAVLAQSTRRVGTYGIANEAFSSIVDLTIIDTRMECILSKRRFENMPPDAIRVKRSNLLKDVTADPPFNEVIRYINGL